MQFNSYSYLLLLCFVVMVFWALPSRLRSSYLLLVSTVFYASWSLRYSLLPFVVCAGVYLCARFVSTDTDKQALYTWSGIGFVLLILVFFKYRVFILANVNALLTAIRLPGLWTPLAIALPLGISFYSFEAISYIIDTRQGRVRNGSFRDLSLFVMFWPHLVAGPIVRFRELAPQFACDKKFEWAMLVRGMDRIIWGLVQKNVIANGLGAWVDEGFMVQAARANTTLDNWFLAIAFGLQIYFDFASYTNIAIGTAELLGIRLPENFRFPYHAASPADFWSRWHMTLSRWIRDYLFFPITARFQGAPLSLYLSLLGVMALVGLWHGASWGFVAWGLLHGIFLAVHRAWTSFRQRKGGALAGLPQPHVLGRAFTLLAVTAAWVPFRASSLEQAVDMLRSMFGGFTFRASYAVNFYLTTLLIALLCLVEPYVSRAAARSEEFLIRRAVLRNANYLLIRPLAYAFGLLLLLMFDDRDAQFIYFQF